MADRRYIRDILVNTFSLMTHTGIMCIILQKLLTFEYIPMYIQLSIIIQKIFTQISSLIVQKVWIIFKVKTLKCLHWQFGLFVTYLKYSFLKSISECDLRVGNRLTHMISDVDG